MKRLQPPLRRVWAACKVRTVPPVLMWLFGARKRSNIPMLRLGTDYGGWWLPDGVLSTEGIAYSAGVGEDISFDLALVNRGWRVFAFDPTPKAVAFIDSLQPLPSRLTFLPVGWYHEAASLKFFAPKDPAHASYSAANLQGTREYVEAPVRPPFALAAELGHSYLHLVKMDIEGVEHEVVSSLLNRGPRFGCLCVEFDQPSPSVRIFRTLARLRRAGYVLVRLDGWNATLVAASEVRRQSPQ